VKLGGGWSGPQCRAPGSVGAVGGVESAQAGSGESPPSRSKLGVVSILNWLVGRGPAKVVVGRRLIGGWFGG
jgi:hypothetical protein